MGVLIRCFNYKELILLEQAWASCNLDKISFLLYIKQLFETYD